MAEKAAELTTREEKIAQGKELYSRGSRNYLVKSYEEAADDLSQVCELYAEIYGEFSNEVGMPYLLYAKSLIQLALEGNKVIDVPDEENDDDDDDDEEDVNEEANGDVEMKDDKEKDKENDKMDDNEKDKDEDNEEMKEVSKTSENKEMEEEAKSVEKQVQEEQTVAEDLSKTNGKIDDAKPGTSNGAVEGETEETEENNDEADEAATNLQLAWEILELAAKVFKNQGESGLPNLAEVYTELANIEFENNNSEPARDDYNRALEIYKNLSTKNYRRLIAEIHYKIGLSYIVDQESKESVKSLKLACELLDEEMNEMKNEENASDKYKAKLQEMEETKQEIWVKINEIEESMQQCISEVKAAIQNHMNPIPKADPELGESSTSIGAGPSSSSSSGEKPKPTDISHLIKRKKPDTPTNDVEMSPAKRPAITPIPAALAATESAAVATESAPAATAP